MKYPLKIIIISFLILSLSLCFDFSAYSAHTETFRITDTYDDTPYSINCTNGKIEIQSTSDCKEFYIDNDIYAVSCYNRNFTFLSAIEKDNGIFRYIIYSYNLRNEVLSFYATDCNADKGNQTFASDKYSNSYLTDSYDRRILYICSETSPVIKITCPDYIKQLMCIDGKCVLAFTQSGVFTIQGNNFTIISDTTPVSPCTYIGNNTIIDTKGVRFLYKSNHIAVISENDNTESDTNINKIVIRENLIYIPAGTTYAQLYKVFDVNKSEFCVLKQDTTPLTYGKLGTGMTATYGNDKYTIIVKGDLTGEGNVNSRDLKAMMKHLTGEMLLGRDTQKAADLNSDNLINTKDLLLLSKLY